MIIYNLYNIIAFVSLQTHISFLRGGVPDGTCSVFVPLCGKSLDMVWLLEQGFSVTGCEISELAVQQFFTENSIPYEKRKLLMATLKCTCNMDSACR